MALKVCVLRGLWDVRQLCLISLGLISQSGSPGQTTSKESIDPPISIPEDLAVTGALEVFDPVLGNEVLLAGLRDPCGDGHFLDPFKPFRVSYREIGQVKAGIPPQSRQDIYHVNASVSLR